MAEMLPRQDIDAKVKVSLLYQTQKLNIFLILSSRILHCKNTFIVHVTWKTKKRIERDYRVLTLETQQMHSLLSCKLLYMQGHGWLTWTFDLMWPIIDGDAPKATRLEYLS